MCDRVITWHIPRDYPGPVSLPYYYMDADYEKVGLRVYAEVAPVDDVKIDIQADEVSIFANTPSTTFTKDGQRTTTPTSTVVLPKGDTVEEDAGDFNGVAIERGQWLRCVIVQLAGARGITFNLELRKVGEDSEDAE